jgi:hypothetical protein
VCHVRCVMSVAALVVVMKPRLAPGRVRIHMRHKHQISRNVGECQSLLWLLSRHHGAGTPWGARKWALAPDHNPHTLLGNATVARTLRAFAPPDVKFLLLTCHPAELFLP